MTDEIMIVILTVSQIFMLWQCVTLTKRIDEIEAWSFKALQDCRELIRKIEDFSKNERRRK